MKRKKNAVSFILKCDKQICWVSRILVLLKLAPKIDYVTLILPFLPDSIHVCKRIVVFKYSVITNIVTNPKILEIIGNLSQTQQSGSGKITLE